MVVGFYAIYLGLSRRAPIEVPGPADVPVDSGEFEKEIGTIGDVGVAAVEVARYMDFNEDGSVSREFGFSKLLHDTGSSWEIEKPFMNIFRPGFTCRITGDRGHVLLEPGLKKPSPKDAALTGNVAIRIIPEEEGRLNEGVFYLDDVIFVSERSLLSSDGSVKFVSRNATMWGSGFELIYNQELDKLEFLRIVELEGLMIKTQSREEAVSSADSGGGAVALSEEAEQPAGSPPGEVEADGYQYRCIFNKNVVIDSPEQLIFADSVVINNIMSQQNSDAGGAAGRRDGVEENDTSAAEDAGQAAPGQMSDEITVTCDDGILVLPTDTDFVFEEQPSGEKDVRAITDKAAGRTTCITERIDYDLVSDSIVAGGKTEFTFYTEAEPNQPEGGGRSAVTIKSNKEARFLPGSRQVVFEGECLCVAPRRGSDGDSTYTLSASKITADLSPDENNESGILFGDIDCLTASGPVTLSFHREVPDAGESKKSMKPLTITAQEKAQFLPVTNEANFLGDCFCILFSDDEDEPQKYTFRSPDITVKLASARRDRGGENITAIERLYAKGPVELAFYPDYSAQVQSEMSAPPVKITANKKAEFLPGSNNQVTFEGESVCTMTQFDAGVDIKRTLSGPLLIINLFDDDDKFAPESAVGIKHVTARGGDVRLATIKSAGEKMLSGYELRCGRFEYDSLLQMVAAFGPGVIKVDNSNITEPEDAPKTGFSLKRRCYAMVENFDTLQYFLDAKKIIAESGEQSMLVNYIPVEEGPTVTVTAGRVEALFEETTVGEDELSALVATDGIIYKDEDKEFIGSELFYNVATSIVKVSGDSSRPCQLNGVLVDQIELDLETNKVKANVVGPGVLQLK